MLAPRFAAGRPQRRLTVLGPKTPWIAAVVLSLPLGNVAAAQYAQPSYADPYGQQPQIAQNPQDAQLDPPSRVARLSRTQGTVSIQPASVQEFAPGEVNYPLTTGDRVWADAGSLAELQLGQVAVRLGQQTDFTVTGLTDTAAQFGIAQGSVHLRTFALDPGTTTELDTPNAAVTVLQPGDVRVDVFPNDDQTVVTLLAGAAQVDAQGFSQRLRPGESLQIFGTEGVQARDVHRPRLDGLDSFSNGQDSAYEASAAAESNYVSDDTIGAEDLGSYGDWNSDSAEGPVWFPRGITVGWQPYRYGHWAYVGPWGWTWIESEPWGFAPFHYGRWGQFGGRWGWVPGPRIVRPVYSPALVAFVGGPGAGVTAWFPLGPREPYQPWYRSSDRYVTRVNVTNIYNRNVNEVRNVYAGRGPSPFRPDPNRQYINRPATVAVPQAVFAGGRPVHEAAMRVNAGQFAGAPVLARPQASPARSIFTPGAARSLPPQIARPELPARNGQGFQRANGAGFHGGNQAPYGQGAGQTYGQSNDGRGNGQGYRQGGNSNDARQQVPGQQPGTGTPGTVQTQPGPGYHGPVGPQRSAQPDPFGTQGPARNGVPAGPNLGAPSQPAQPGNAQPENAQSGNAQPSGGQRPPVTSQPGAPGQTTVPVQPGSNYGPVGPQRGRLDGSNIQQQPRPIAQPSAPAQVAAPNQPSGYHSPVGPQNGRQPDAFNPQQQPRQAAPTAPVATPDRPAFNRTEPQQPRQRMDPQPANNAPQNRPAAPPMQYIPRPAPQGQPQAQPQPRPQPAPQPNRQPPPATPKQ